jgi:hypothetical protein
VEPIHGGLENSRAYVLYLLEATASAGLDGSRSRARHGRVIHLPTGVEVQPGLGCKERSVPSWPAASNRDQNSERHRGTGNVPCQNRPTQPTCGPSLRAKLMPPLRSRGQVTSHKLKSVRAESVGELINASAGTIPAHLEHGSISPFSSDHACTLTVMRATIRSTL